MKIISWNVNGLRSLIAGQDLNDFLEKYKPNIFCMSEIKLKCPYVDIETTLKTQIKGYKYRYWNVSKCKAGYSGVCVWSKKEPINVTFGFKKEHDEEGRIITCEYDDFYLVQCYIPNSGESLKRLDYRTKEWDIDFMKYLKKLSNKKSLIVCGDLNVANDEIDIHNPKTNTKNAGFTEIERTNFKLLLSKTNLIDTFRYLHHELVKYSYWSNFSNSRKQNKGWRIDYFLVSEKMINKLKKSDVLIDILGSDHAPIILEIK